MKLEYDDFKLGHKIFNNVMGGNMDNPSLKLFIDDYKGDKKRALFSHTNALFLNVLLNELNFRPDGSEEKAIESRKIICESLNGKLPPKPKFPNCRIIKEGTVGDCPKCHSTTVRKYGMFGKKIGCIQPKCENYYKFVMI